MNRRSHCLKVFCLGMTVAMLSGGCSGETGGNGETGRIGGIDNKNNETGISIEEKSSQTATGIVNVKEDAASKPRETEDAGWESVEPENAETEEADWSGYFDGLNGAAVIYDASDRRYQVFHGELADTRRSPCSTFKIVSSLIALENGILEPGHSTRAWSGEVFWNEKWNRDIDFEDAFRESCVWYFRELADEIGQETMQRELEKLSYGNCDCSDWEGRLNTNNNNRALTGFWLESSLAISPKEQAEVMERIFGEDSVYSEETKEELRRVMAVTEQTKVPIYGKTGMGKAEGVVVDAWFTGFAQGREGNVYFCVYSREQRAKYPHSCGYLVTAARVNIPLLTAGH